MRGFGLPGWADLDEAEAHRRQAIDAAAILVEPGGEADAVREPQTCDADRVVHAGLGPQALQWRVLEARQRSHRQLVSVLGVEPEQERAGKGIGQQRHGRDCRKGVRAARRLIFNGHVASMNLETDHDAAQHHRSCEQ
jgi:hypothetical protein